MTWHRLLCRLGIHYWGPMRDAHMLGRYKTVNGKRCNCLVCYKEQFTPHPKIFDGHAE